MRQLVVLLCVLGVFAGAATADRVETWTETWSTVAEPGGKLVTITDFIFELEDFADGIVYGPGETAQVTFGDVTLTISRPDSFFQFSNLAPFGGPSEFGNRSLDPFVDVFNPAPIVFDVAFGAPGLAVVRFGIDAGDFGPSDRDLIEIPRKAPVEIDNNAVPGFSWGSFNGLPIGAAQPNETSFSVKGGSPDLPSSVFWDNIRISVIGVEDLPTAGFGGGGADTFPNSLGGPGYPTGLALPAQPIPEPGTLALVGIGLAAAVLLRRRR